MRGRPPISSCITATGAVTSFDFTGVLKAAEITISMDGRGRCMDNIFIERLWRSLKYEAVYLHELTDGFKAERVIGGWIDFYNTEWPHPHRLNIRNSWRHDQQPEYTLTEPPNYPTMWDQFSRAKKASVW